MRKIIFITAFCLAIVAVNAQKINEPIGNPEWSQPYAPFRVVGNVYYVGTYDLACYLITSSKGHILINTGLAASADLIKKNVETLGFKVSDIKILTTTQAHYDHTGALASLKKQTGAKMYADASDASVIADGGASDYEMSARGVTFEPVKVDRKLNDGDVIELGDVKMTMLHHPGHTKGSCSFMLDVKDEINTYKVLIVNFPTIITGRRLSDIPEYPEISKDILNTLEAQKKLTFDIWLSAHASQFFMHNKHKSGDAYNPQAFVDRAGYDKSLGDLQAAYEKKLKQN